MDDKRAAAQRAQQEFLTGLHQDPGCTVQIKWTDSGMLLSSFSAGIRVLSATPIFDRSTGDILHWRYWLLFAEMGVLDPYGGRHPVHCFECEVMRQSAFDVVFRETGGTYEFLVCRNDPHEDDERQAGVYREWARSVKELGGEDALQALLDRQAEGWTQTLRSTGEMKP
jgi:hypothetical protein